MCHDFDVKFGRFWEDDNTFQKADMVKNTAVRDYYLSSSLLEEAIYSSKMERVSTTRLMAKEMLRKKKNSS